MFRSLKSEGVVDENNYVEVLRKKNQYVGTVFIAGITFVQLFNGVLGVPVSLIATVLGILYAVLLPTMLLGYFRKTRLSAEIVRYALMLIVIGFWAVSITLDPNVINILFMVFFVTLMGIYQEITTNAITLILSLSLLVYFYTTDMAELLFGGATFFDFIYYAIAYLLISLSGFVIGSFNNKLLKSLRSQREETEKSSKQLESLLGDIESTLENLKEYQENSKMVSTSSQEQVAMAVHKLEGVQRLMAEQLTQSEELVQESVNSLTQIEVLTDNLKEVDSNIESTKEFSEMSVHRVANIAEELNEFTQVVEEITKRTSGIIDNANNITKVLNALQAVAKQTEILALNAGIESARAGEAGRGFAVIAKEIKSLAGTSQESATSLSPVVEDIQDNLKSISELFGKTERGIIASKSGLNEIESIVGTIAEKNDISAVKVKEMYSLGDSLNHTLMLLQSALTQSTATADSTREELLTVTDSVNYTNEATTKLVESFDKVGTMLDGITTRK